MTLLRIQLLGPPAVYTHAEPLIIQRRMQRALLFYLAYQSEPIDRAHLMLMFWPEADEKTGRRRIRETLSKLRSELPDPSLLVTEQDQVSLDRSQISVDALEFNRLFQHSHRVASSIPRHLPLPAQTHHMMKEALDLWRAPNFMSGVQMTKSLDLDRWLMETSAQLERRRIILVDRLSDHYAASGDFESAISRLNTILENDPENLAWQMRYIKWLHQLGRRSEAQAYTNDLHKLYRETGESIPEELLALTAQVQKLDIPEKESGYPYWPPASILETNFFGRKEELQVLQGALQRGGAVLLLGESGSGKTRLLHEFWQHHAPGTRLLVAPAYPSTQHLSFQPLLEMLRQAISPQEWQRISPTWIAPLAHFIPELNTYVQTPARIEDTFLDDIPGMVFECLHQVLKEISAQKRLMVFLEDAQFSDKTTLDGLAYLLSRGFFQGHGLLVLSIRIEEMEPSVEAFIEQIRKLEPLLPEIHLAELSLQDADELITGVLGRPYPDPIVKKLLKNTSGLPLHLIETLRMILEYSPETNLEEIIDHLPLPNSIRELVSRKMKALSSPALKVLQIVAIAYGSISPALIEKAAGMSVEEVVRALEELECRRLIVTAAQETPGLYYYFPYGRIRKAVLAEISDARKRMLHLSVARAMQSIPLESSSPAMIAQHFEAAGELKPAFDYWVKTGVKAARRYAHSETNFCFNRAASLMKSLGDFVSDDEIYKLYQVWGDELDYSCEYQEGVKLYHRLQTLGDQRQSDLLLGTAFNGLSRVFRKLDKYQKSLHYNDLALAHLEPCGPIPEYVYAHNRRAVTLTLLDDFEESYALLQKSLVFSEGQRHRRIQIGLSSVFVQIANIWMFKGEPDKGLAIVGLAEQSLFSSINNPDTEMIRIIGAQIYAVLGYPRKAHLLCQEALQKAKEWNNRRLESYARVVRSFSAMALGYMDECLNDLEDALPISRQFKYHPINQQACSNLGDFYRLSEDFELAEAAYLEGLKTSALSYYRLETEAKLAYTRFLNGSEQDGTSLLETAIQEAENHGFTYIKLSGKIMQTSMLIRTQQIDQAEQIIQEIIQESQAKGMTILKANIRLYSGLCSLRKGRLEEAIHNLDEGIEITRQNGNIWVESAILKLKKQILESQGEEAAEITRRQLEIKDFLLEHARRPEIRAMILRYFEHTHSS